MGYSATQDFVAATDLWGRLVRTTNFVLDHWWLWLLIGGLLWLALSVRRYHALLAKLDERCEAAFADVDTLLAERHALVGNLAETVKGFAGQERTVLKEVMDARARAMSTAGNARLEAENQIGQSLTSLFAISENYPELASSGHFRDLRAELVRIEDRINAARRFLNLAIEELNAVRRSFPGNVIVKLSAVGAHEKFTLGERRADLTEPVKVSF